MPHTGPVDTTLLTAIRSALAPLADPGRAAAQRQYLKSAMPMHGISLPTLRRTVRPLLVAAPLWSAGRPAWEATVRALWDQASVREERYAATELAVHRRARAFVDADLLPPAGLAHHLVSTGAWWDLIDPLATGLVGAALVRDPAARPVVERWSIDDDLWVRRAAIICQVGRHDETDRELLATVVDANLDGTAYGHTFWIRKAIGWALRDYSPSDPDWVRGQVAGWGDRLAPLSRREALRRIT